MENNDLFYVCFTKLNSYFYKLLIINYIRRSMKKLLYFCEDKTV